MAKITKQDKEYLAGSVIILVVVGGISTIFIPSFLPLITGLIVLCAVLYRIMTNHRKLHRSIFEQQEILYRHSESFFAIVTSLGVSGPIPFTRGYAASPDFLRIIANHTLLHQPKIVLEASSGLSTVILAYCQKKTGGGTVISLDHLEEYATQTTRLLEAHNLSDFAKVYHAPLTEYSIGGKKYKWYNISGVPIPKSIDLIVVDGPVSGENKHCRYPVLPLFFEKMKEGSSLFMDDAYRKSEREVKALWEGEFGDQIASAFVESEKGTLQIRKVQTR